jgi:hypothetical protein
VPRLHQRHALTTSRSVISLTTVVLQAPDEHSARRLLAQ